MKLSKTEILSRYIELEDMLGEICAIIYYQSSLSEQDRWLKMMIDEGMWKPEKD